MKNMESRIADAIESLANSYVGQGPLPHMQTLVSIDGEEMAATCHGAARAGGEPLRADAIFRIASMSKPIMVAAFLLLVEQGCVRLDTPVVDVMPEFADIREWTGNLAEDGSLVTIPAKTTMTMLDLLRHTAGLSYSFHANTPVERLYAERYLDTFHQRRTSDEYAAALAEIPLLFSPGERFHYSVSIDLLGLVIERVAGEPLDRFLARHIFAPLGMIDTGFVLRPEQGDRLTDAWQTDGVNPPTLYDRGEQSRWRMEQKCYSAGGGLLSTARDYHRFLRMLLNGGELDGARVISQASVDRMMTNHLPGGYDLEREGSLPLSETSLPGIGMGLGGAVIVDPARARAPGSEGTYFWGGILSTGFFLDRKKGLIGIVMTQLMPSGVTALRENFRRAIYGAIDQHG